MWESFSYPQPPGKNFLGKLFLNNNYIINNTLYNLIILSHPITSSGHDPAKSGHYFGRYLLLFGLI